MLLGRDGQEAILNTIQAIWSTFLYSQVNLTCQEASKLAMSIQVPGIADIRTLRATAANHCTRIKR